MVKMWCSGIQVPMCTKCAPWSGDAIVIVIKDKGSWFFLFDKALVNSCSCY